MPVSAAPARFPIIILTDTVDTDIKIPRENMYLGVYSYMSSIIFIISKAKY